MFLLGTEKLAIFHGCAAQSGSLEGGLSHSHQAGKGEGFEGWRLRDIRGERPKHPKSHGGKEETKSCNTMK